MNLLTAAAKYFRAYGYFNLVIRWGGVPLITSTTTAVVKRSTAADIWALIKADLQAVIADLPSLSTITTDPKYTVSKEAAQALLAKLSLYTGDNTTAATLAEGLITNPAFALETNFLMYTIPWRTRSLSSASNTSAARWAWYPAPTAGSSIWGFIRCS